jgi:hypothetical protein
MNIYELVNPSDAWTFLAPSDKVAFLVALAVGRGQTSAKRDGWEGGMYVFGLGDPDKDFKKEFGEELEGAVGRHKADLIKSLRTFMIHREKAKKVPTGKALAKWNDKHRSSLNDFSGEALKLADHLKKNLEKKKGTG